MVISQIQMMIDHSRYRDVLGICQTMPEIDAESQLYLGFAHAMLGEFAKAQELTDEIGEMIKQEENELLQFAVEISSLVIKIFRSDADVPERLVKIHDILDTIQNRENIGYWIVILYLVEGFHHYVRSDTKILEEYTSRLLDMAEQLDWDLLKVFSRFYQSVVKIISGSYDRDISDLHAVVEESRSHGYQIVEGYANSGISAFYVMQGDFENYRKYMDRAGEIWSDIEYRIGIAFYTGALGLYYINIADLGKALEHYNNALSLTENMGSRFLHGSYYRFIGEVYYRRGEFSNAVLNYQKSLDIRKEDKDIHGVGESYSHIGKIYHNHGDLDSALMHYEKGLKARESIHYNPGVAASCDLLGKLYFDLDNISEAKKCFSRSLEINRKMENDFSTARSLFNLIRVLTENDELEVERYLHELQIIDEKLENKQVHLFAQVAEALVLKTSSRGVHKSQAQLILQEIGTSDIANHELSVIALLNLIEILLWELRASQDKEILQEIEDAIDRLEALATAQNIPYLVVRTYLFRSKLALVEFQVERARDLLHNAYDLAQEKGLRYLAIITSNELDLFYQQIVRWKDIAGSKTYDQSREVTQFGHPFKATNDLDNHQLIPETPILLLILGQGGVSLYSHKFTDTNIKEELVGSFLSAIDSFGRETFSQRGSIERIVHQEYTILVKSVNEYLFCYVISGSSYAGIQRLDAFVESVQTSSLWQHLVGSPHIIEQRTQLGLEKLSAVLFQTNEDAVPIEIAEEDTVSEEGEYLELPTELLSYKFLLNPIRLSIIKVLDTYFRYPAAELRKLLQIPWGTFNDHMVALDKKGYIESKKEFVEESPRTILYLTSGGASEYSSLKSLLNTLVAS